MYVKEYMTRLMYIKCQMMDREAWRAGGLTCYSPWGRIEWDTTEQLTQQQQYHYLCLILTDS